MNQESKLYATQKQQIQGQEAGAGKAPTDELELDAKRHDRGYNPIDDAENGTVSEKLNSDAGRYKKGPGPF